MKGMSCDTNGLSPTSFGGFWGSESSTMYIFLHTAYSICDHKNIWEQFFNRFLYVRLINWSMNNFEKYLFLFDKICKYRIFLNYQFK